MHGLLNPKKNPWFEHARAQFWLAQRGGKVVGRISAQVDDLVLEHMGAGTGQWGMFEALDGRGRGGADPDRRGLASRAGHDPRAGPFSLSIWDEPGLEIEGFAEPPTAMMGHHRPEYQAWVEAAGYEKAKDLVTYELDITNWHDPLINRLIAAGERNPRIRIRQVDKSQVRRGSAADPQPPQRRLVEQLGLRPADRIRDRLCRQEAEADHLQGAGARSPRSMASRSPSC